MHYYFVITNYVMLLCLWSQVRLCNFAMCYARLVMYSAKLQIG